MSAGKGSAPRPFDIPREVYESNHDRIFGKRERKPWTPPPLPEPEQRPSRQYEWTRPMLPDELVVDGYQEKARD